MPTTLSLPGYVAIRLVRESARARVYEVRRKRDDVRLIAKLYDLAEPGSEARVEHEFRVLEGLEFPGVVRARGIERVGRQLALLLDWVDGQNLQELAGGAALPVERVVRIALELSATLAKIHARRIIHRDIKPSNILIEAESGRAVLADFGISVLLEHERRHLDDPAVLEGTLPYISPEQTGRMQREVDVRSDLYSLGVTLYELLAGERPFVGKAPLELVHAHLAQVPRPPHERVAGIPRLLSTIVSKLLAKAPEHRYQSAQGLLADLERFAAAQRAGELEPSFELGEHDFSASLQLPHQLYGRERERARLVAALADVVARERPRVVLITGPAGSGKTSLMHELATELGNHTGYFGFGWFDPPGDAASEADALPYLGPIRATRAVLEQILTESDEQLASWRARLRTALGPLVAVAAQLVPELQLIVGEFEPVPEVEPGEARNRLHLTLARLLAAIAERAPLVVVLDDLQWRDAASSELLTSVLREQRVRGPVLFVGSQRGESIDELAPLAPPDAEFIELGPLPDDALARLLADVLRRRTDEVAPLAAIIGRKSGNNPMFVRLLLISLVELELLRCGERGWEWQLDAIASAALPEDLLDIMRAKLDRLSARELRVLALAACIGDRFELELLATIAELATDELTASLYALESAGLITEVGLAYQFGHERIRAAARERLDADARRRVHRRIGHELWDRAGDRALTDARLFEIVDQLNLGLGGRVGADDDGEGDGDAERSSPSGSLIDDERGRVAMLNLDAGQRALRSAAWRAARRYFAVATTLFAGTRQDAVGFAAQFGLAQTLALANDTAAADEAFAELLEWPLSLVERSEVIARRINILRLQDQVAPALALARAGLEACGIDVPHTVSRARMAFELLRAWRGIVRLELDDFLRMPDASDERAVAAMYIINAAKLSAFMVDPHIYMYLVAQHVRLLCRAGYHPTAPEGLVQLSFAALAGERLVDAERIAATAVALSERRPCTPAVAVESASVYLMFVGPTARPFAEFIGPIERLQQRALEAGERLHAADLGSTLAYLRFETGAYLEEVSELAHQTKLLSSDVGAREPTLLADFVIWMTQMLGADGDGDGDEPEPLLPELLADPKVPRSMQVSAGTSEAIGRVLRGEFEQAREVCEPLQTEHERSLLGMYTLARHAMIDGIVAAEIVRAEPHRRRAMLRRIHKRLAVLRRYAEVCPQNYLASQELVLAELAWVRGQAHEAYATLERARARAGDQGLVCIEALACMRLVRLASTERWPSALDGALRAARSVLQRWGATTVLRKLEQRYPSEPALVEAAGGPATESRSSVELGGSVSSRPSGSGSASSLDLASVLGAVQAISEDLRLEQVIPRVLARAIENAGADRGLLLLERAGTIAVVAEGDTSASLARLDRPLALAVAGTTLPSSVVNFVLRTGEAVIVEEARADPRFANDPYIAGAGVRSMLCMPIHKQREQIGALVLENRSSAGVFTHKRLATLELILSQAASALDNARLYARVQRSEAQWRSLVDGVPDLIMVVDARGRVEFVNRPELLGKPGEVLRGQQAAELFAAESTAAWRERLAAVVESGAIAELELVVELAGVRRWLAARICPIARHEHGEEPPERELAERYLAIATDVTARKALEAQVRQQQRLESVGTLASGVAHEINNPIQGIMNYAELLRERPRDPEAVLEFSGEIMHEAQRVTTIVRSLLTFARKDSDPDFELRELAALIDDTLSLVRAVLRKDQITLVVERAPTLPKVRCRGQQIQQIIMNLVTNARDALNQRDAGDGAHKRIEIRAAPFEHEGAAWVRVTVEDNGSGIPEHLRASIFDPFFTTKGRDQGTGLGLALSHKIADDHGGRIRLDSEVGVGTQFHLELPVARD